MTEYSDDELEELDNLIEEKAGSLAQDYQAALNKVQGCSVELAQLQKELKLYLQSIYADNPIWLNTSLKESVDNIAWGAPGTSAQRTETAAIYGAKDDRQLILLQQAGQTWPAKVLDIKEIEGLEGVSHPSLLPCITLVDASQLYTPDFTDVDYPAAMYLLDTNLKAQETLKNAKMPGQGVATASLYPQGLVSLYAGILAQCELLVSFNMMIDEEAARGLTMASSLQMDSSYSHEATYDQISHINHRLYKNVYGGTEQLGSGVPISAVGPDTLYEILQYGGYSVFNVFGSQATTYVDDGIRRAQHVEIQNISGQLSPIELLKYLNAGAAKFGNFHPTDAELASTTPSESPWAVGSDWIVGLKKYLQDVANNLLRILGEMRRNSECIYRADVALREKQQKVFEDLASERPIFAENPEVLQKALDNLMLGNLEEFIGESGFFASQILFKEQCWLLAYVDLLARYKKEHLDVGHGGTIFSSTNRGTYSTPRKGTAKKFLPYVNLPQNPERVGKLNSTLLVDSDPYAFINRLTFNPHLPAYLNIDNHELSNLQPKIRLSKVIYEKEGSKRNDLREVEFDFESYFDTSRMVGPGKKTNILQDRKRRGSGVGITSFDFAYDGSNPFAIKKSITANLKLYATDIKELFEVRGGQNGSPEWRYVDLALKTGDVSAETKKCFNHIKENADNYALNFRLRAHVGMARPTTLINKNNEGLKEALQDAYVTLNLTPTVHNFELDEMGRVVFNITYLAYIEEMFDQPVYNIFANARSATNQKELVALKRIQRQFELEFAQKNCGNKEMDELREKFEDQIASETSLSLQMIIQTLMTEGRIQYVPLDSAMMASFANKGPSTKEKGIRRRIEKFLEGKGVLPLQENLKKLKAIPILNNAIDLQADLEARTNQVVNAHTTNYKNRADTDKQTSVAKVLTEGADPNTYVISYFYVSDLIDIILSNIEKELKRLPDELVDIQSDYLDVSTKEVWVREKRKELEQYALNLRRLRVVLGPAELFTTAGADGGRQSHIISLGDIPISVKYFLEWMTDKMLKKQEVFYSFTKFLNDLFNDLVRNFLNNEDCFGYSIKQKTRVQQATLTSYTPDPNIDPLTAMAQEQNSTRLDLGLLPQGRRLLELSGPSESVRTTIPIQNEINYFTYFIGRVQPFELMNGNKAQDEGRGIFHYLLGRDKGIIKNIKMSKTQTPGLAEVRFEQEGYDGLSQLRVIYDVQIETFANVQTFPGTYIYVDPQGFSPSGKNIPDSNLTLTDLGIGGYYMIYKSEHGFGRGYAQSIIHAKWVHAIQQEEALRDCQVLMDASAGNGGRMSPWCRITEASKK